MFNLQNWPFGFHHHLSHSPLTRSTSLNTLINSNSSNNNWCPRHSTEEQMKDTAYESENYSSHQQQVPSSSIGKAFLNHENTPQYNHWFSETPSPELNTSTNSSLTFENSHPQHHHQQQQQQQLLHSSHNHQLQPPASTHSTTFQLPPELQQHHHHHTLTLHNLPSASHHIHQNSFGSSSNFQSTSIR